jgi:hypothetical protein
MHATKSVIFAFVVALLGIVAWAGYQAGWVEHFAGAPACVEASTGALKENSIIEYGHSSSGVVGTYITLLSVDKSGHVKLGHGLGGAYLAGETQLTSEELANLLHTIEAAGFRAFRSCYGHRAQVNPQNAWIFYRSGAIEKEVVWLSAPREPTPPQGWFRVAELLDQIEARAEKQASSEPSVRSRD